MLYHAVRPSNSAFISRFLFQHIAAHLLSSSLRCRISPPVSPVPSRNLVVDCKDSRAVIVIFGTHRVAQLLRDFDQRDVVGAFCDANLTFGGMFFFRDLFELTDAPDAQDDKSSWRVPDDAGL